jgi:hypothetical protein
MLSRLIWRASDGEPPISELRLLGIPPAPECQRIVPQLERVALVVLPIWGSVSRGPREADRIL